MNQNKQTTQWNTEQHVLKYYKALKSFGAPVDFIRDSAEFSSYRVMVVPAYQQMSQGLIENVGADSNNGDLEYSVLKRVYDYLNIPVEHYPPGIVVEYRDGFGIALNYADGEFTLNLPDNTERLIGKNVIPTAGVLVWKTEEWCNSGGKKEKAIGQNESLIE